MDRHFGELWGVLRGRVILNCDLGLVIDDESNSGDGGVDFD
jgi:hypothetical protein